MSKIDKYQAICIDQESEVAISGRGKNVIPPPEKEPLWRGFLDKFKDPLIIVLLVVFFFSILVSCYEVYNGSSYSSFIEPMGVLVALLLATGIGFWFEVKAAREFDVLNQVKNKRKVKAVRNVEGKCQTLYIPKHDVVVGDIIKLDSGDEIPADGILLEAKNLRVDESNFTGEVYANKKASSQPSPEGEGASDAAYPCNMVLRSSTVIEGDAVMQVQKIGTDTEEGKGVELAHENPEVKTPLNIQLDNLGKYISYGSFIIAGLIVLGRLLYYYITIGNTGGFEWMGFFEMLLNSIMIAVALIVVAVPEGLPMSVTVSLALSMRKMLKENNLVRKLHACETMGAATVICTDKTGTLTQNKMQVVDAEFYGAVERELIVRAIAVNSNASLSKNEKGDVVTIGNPTEGALLRWITQEGDDYEAIRGKVNEVEVKPFSTETKYMSTTIDTGEQFIKGAPEVVLNMCDVIPSDTSRENILEKLSSYQAKGMRTLAFAFQSANSNDIVFMGMVAIADPVRKDVPEAIRICSKQAHVRVIMVTGDNALTAKEIGIQSGLIDQPDTAITITGEEFAALSDEKAKELIKNPDFKVLSRAKPHDKARLVTLLQQNGEVVAVTGDGTNDAPALKKAQVGLSMGDGTARAKEASDITIIDNSFASINTAILWGRSLYLNIRRFIIFQMTINVAACLIVLYGAFMGLDSPLNVTQMLWVNLIMDTFAAMALSSLPADKRVMNDKPRRTDSQIIDKGMGTMILGVGLLFFCILVGLWQMLSHGDYSSVQGMLHDFDWDHLTDFSMATHVRNPHEIGIFFTFFVLLQVWNIFNARYFRTGRSLIQDLWNIVRKPQMIAQYYSSGFVLVLAAIIVGQVLIVNIFGEMFGVEALSLSDWKWLIMLSCPVLIIGELCRIVKKFVSLRSDGERKSFTAGCAGGLPTGSERTGVV